MSKVHDNGDSRLHLEEGELYTLAQEMVKHLRILMGETAEHKACRDCMGNVMLQAFLELVTQAMEERHVGEITDLVMTAGDGIAILEKVRHDLAPTATEVLLRRLIDGALG